MRISKRVLITGIAAVAVALVGLTLAILQPVSANPPVQTGNDGSSGLSTKNLGL